MTDPDPLDAVKEVFVFPMAMRSALAELDMLETKPSMLLQPFVGAFCTTLRAIHSFTLIPYSLALASTDAALFKAFLTSESIRRVPLREDPPQTEVDRVASQDEANLVASRTLIDFIKTAEGRAVRQTGVATMLLELVRQPQSHGSVELLQQAVVALWSALETLFRDCACALLNQHPAIALQLAQSPNTKKHFELRLDADDLSATGFDLTNRMGDLLLGDRDFSNLRTIHAIASVLLPEPAARDALSAPLFRELNQLRHLIVHRCGIVDRQYIEQSVSEHTLGERRTISPLELASLWRAATDVAVAIVAAFDRLSASGPQSSKSSP